MADLQAALSVHRRAVDAFLDAARAIPPAQWSQPRAPGKWSPGQVTEHLALAYEAGHGVVRGTASTVSVPRLFRPLIRKFLLNPVLRRGRFMSGSRSPKIFYPSASPAAPEALIGRLQAAASVFEKEVGALREAAVEHPFFGKLPIADFVRLQEVHTQHHRGQMHVGGV